MEKTTRILLVDDERPVRRSMEKTFLRADFEVDTAGDVTEGLALFKAELEGEQPFDIAVLDLNMPNFDGVESPDAGFDLLQKLLETQPELPVIVLTAFDTVSKAKVAITAGARDYFVKGREEGLVKLVRKTLNLGDE
ncbi:MAG: response regulator [Thermoflexales bacterium]|nr:response regulator [Thermoflexales bacterium]